MLDSFVSYIRNHGLFGKEAKLLLAFSGGVDSVVLAHLLREAGHTFDLAHCHFNLRGDEADGDEAFCLEQAEQLGCRLHHQRFDTKGYAATHDLSIQMAARELRYTWFRELKAKHGYDHILTAHHADDSIETFFVNLVRGSGLNGLTGIAPQQNEVVRPLLFAFKNEILEYAQAHALPHRHDSSNQERKYKRNYLRHEVIPVLRRLNPSFGQTMVRNMARLEESEQMVAYFAEEKFKAICSQEEALLRIDIELLLAEPCRKSLLHRWLYPLGFNENQVDQLLQSLSQGAHPGKLFNSPTHRLTVAREHLLVMPRSFDDADEHYLIGDVNDLGHLPVALRIERSGDLSISPLREVASLDADLVSFPLTLRRWKAGDSFKPLGMKGFRKLSDFFTSEKMNQFEKENTWILESGGNIIWVLNRRIDERFRLTEKTKQILKITYL